MADISMSFFSQMMGRHVNVKIILPFDTAHLMGFQEPYKTIYFLPGYSGNAASILSGTILAEEVAYKGFAVVLPDGENSFYMDQPDTNAFYEKFVAEELVQVTRKLLPCLSTKREDTYIGGISMGGYGCLMIGCRHMDTFSKIVALSPCTHAYQLFDKGFTPAQIDYYFKGEANYLQNYHPINLLKQAKAEGKEIPDIYMCCGKEDPLTYVMDCEFAKEAKEAGLPVTFREDNGTHDTKFWNKWLPEAIDFALRT